MGTDSKQPEREAEEPNPPKKKAEENPWYLLATLYGVSEFRNEELRKKNRVAWNRYFAGNLDEARRAQLITMKRHTPEELTPFSSETLHEIEEAFASRCKCLETPLVLPKSDSGIDFSNVQFDRYVTFERHLFFDKADFENSVFDGQADFAGATFLGMASFENAAFSGMAGFDSVAFASPAIFSCVRFFENTFFANATFFSLAFFVGVTFSCGNPIGNTLFTSAEFHYEANFLGTTFGGVTNFDRAKFFRNVGFLNATFSRATKFNKVTFFDDVNFESTTFSEEIALTKAIFVGSSRFINAKMNSKTSFKGATFKTKPPEFFGAELHEGSVWPSREAWPIPKATDEAEDFIHAYERLKLEMDLLKKHEDELDFFALELQSRRVLLGPWRGLPIWLYGVLSDYGRGYARPFLWLLVVVAIGAVLLVFSHALPIEKSFGLSVANTLNVFGFRKDFFEPHLFENLPAPLQILAATQTIFGTILLFLFGLGIRNKFRMK